jgi:hypothetical protein
MAPIKGPELLCEREDAERVVYLERERVVGCRSIPSLRVEDSLCQWKGCDIMVWYGMVWSNSCTLPHSGRGRLQAEVVVRRCVSKAVLRSPGATSGIVWCPS